MPLDPVTWIEEAFVSVTVSVADCPAEMLLELAVMETVGAEAAALAANAENARKVRRGANDGNAFIMPALSCLLNWRESDSEQPRYV